MILLHIKSYRTSENNSKITKTKEKSDSKQPCKICERKGKKNRYAENLCWFKEDKDKGAKINKITNSILEIDKHRRSKKLDVPPLIEVKVLLNGNIKCRDIYDSGSNITLINSKLVKSKNLMKNSFNGTTKQLVAGVKLMA